uniref:ATP synthase protein 8 n=1 Tax=Leptogium corticola TaxID=586073 RepID=A0A8K1VZR0_9LECA|nr:ATP8 [Leptogium corticola]
MPQLVPFYFSDQSLFAFITIILKVYFFSKYILPLYLRLFLTRFFITKLG